MKQFDVAIVGGSFAGLSCAKHLSLQGVNTLVLERKKSIDYYTQSTGIFVKEIAEQISLPHSLSRKITGIRLYTPNMNCIPLSSPNYYFLATHTSKVLQWMADRARISGTTIRCNQRVVNSVTKNNRLTLVTSKDSQFHCSYLVASDGAKSQMAKQQKLGQNQHFLLGVELEVTGFDHLDNNAMHVFLDSHFAPGYIGWLLHGVKHTQIGLAVNYPNKPDIHGFLKKLHSHFGGKVKILSRRGGLIPSGGIVSPLSNTHACILGDAAGMVSPLTAGGIHPAIQIGETLANSINQYLNNGGPPPYKNVHLPSYRGKKLLRRTYNTLTPPNWVLNQIMDTEIARRIAKIIFFHNRGLLCARAWREIILGY